MDVPMMDSYLESVAGYVRDEDKLVTYKWLSKELEVHVNIAKLILWRYWQQYKDDKLVATFMLIGNLRNGGMRVEVVKDSDLPKAKEKFEKIVSEHVYSLQKTLPDIELLAGSGKGDSKYSAITCEKSVILSDEELLTMRWGKAINPAAISAEKKAQLASSSEKKGQVVSSEKKTSPIFPNKKESNAIKEIPKKSEKIDDAEANSEQKTIKKITPPTKQKNDKKGALSKKPVQTTKAGFGHLFGKAGNQQKNQAATSSSMNGPSESSRKSSSGSSPEIKSAKPATDNLFSKPRAKENEDSSNSETKVSVSSTPEKETASKASAKKIEKATESKKSKTKKNKKPLRGTKRERSNDSAEETKKRKRIVVASDSSEESGAASEDEDMFESPPPEPPKRARSPSPPSVVRDGKKRKVRKLVDKTFLDEDGYLVTRKESVYESCSDEEPEVVEAKTQSEPERPKEPKINVKKKQTSLMSFFKKG